MLNGACSKQLAAAFLVLASSLSAPHLGAQGYAPNEAARHMTVPEGFEVNLVASEPMIAQPVCIEFDDRGRLWVVQYLQYPNPSGLQRVKVDRFSRTKYDKVQDPPPRGLKGWDRITSREEVKNPGGPAGETPA